MNLFLYKIFLLLYPLTARLISPVNNKARKWVKGRRKIFERIGEALLNDSTPKIWFHAASLGEFEQGRPLMEMVKKKFPHYKLVLTFFSPSGYQYQKNYRGADYIFYLPMDSAKNAEHFLDLVSPDLIVFVKYEYWYYYLNEAYSRKIPTLLISGIFLQGMSFFKWYGKLGRRMLSFFTHLFVQTDESFALLKSIQVTNVSVSGDTRFDRVIEVAKNHKADEAISFFTKNKITIVAGSTWTEDDEALDHYANTHSHIQFIIAPHDISEERLKECSNLYKNSILYSAYNPGEALENKNVLIIDNIGQLKYLYKYAAICYIGGGFGGNGIHNVLEAAVYSKPLIFGPEYEKFAEAIDLVDTGAAFPVEDAIVLEKELDRLINDTNALKHAGEIAGNYVNAQTGATQKICRYIQKERWLKQAYT